MCLILETLASIWRHIDANTVLQQLITDVRSLKMIIWRHFDANTVLQQLLTDIWSLKLEWLGAKKDKDVFCVIMATV